MMLLIKWIWSMSQVKHAWHWQGIVSNVHSPIFFPPLLQSRLLNPRLSHSTIPIYPIPTNCAFLTSPWQWKVVYTLPKKSQHGHRYSRRNSRRKSASSTNIQMAINFRNVYALQRNQWIHQWVKKNRTIITYCIRAIANQPLDKNAKPKRLM